MIISLVSLWRFFEWSYKMRSDRILQRHFCSRTSTAFPGKENCLNRLASSCVALTKPQPKPTSLLRTTLDELLNDVGSAEHVASRRRSDPEHDQIRTVPSCSSGRLV